MLSKNYLGIWPSQRSLHLTLSTCFFNRKTMKSSWVFLIYVLCLNGHQCAPTRQEETNLRESLKSMYAFLTGGVLEVPGPRSPFRLALVLFDFHAHCSQEICFHVWSLETVIQLNFAETKHPHTHNGEIRTIE